MLFFTASIVVEVDAKYPSGPDDLCIGKSNPIKTSKTSFLGTYNMLGLARRVGAKLLFASTSEVYGDPEVNPQNENYLQFFPLCF